MTRLKVVQLCRYPVKSMAGERVSATAVHATGFEGDRRWGVVDRATGRVLTAKRDMRLLFASAHRKLDSCSGQVVTVVLGAAGAQWPMCLEHLVEHLASLQQIRLDR